MRHIATLEALADFLEADLSPYDADHDVAHPGIRLDLAATQLARAVKKGERPAIAIAHRLIMLDPHLPFGKLIKSNVARALKQQTALLTEAEKLALADQTITLLCLPFCPREAEDYCRLVKRMGRRFVSRVVARSHPVNDKARALVAALGIPYQHPAER